MSSTYFRRTTFGTILRGDDWVKVTVPYKLVEGPTFSAGQDGATAREKYIIREGDLKNFYALSFPIPFALSTKTAWSLLRADVNDLPRALPGRPGVSSPNKERDAFPLRTVRIDAEPLNNDLPGDPVSGDFEDTEFLGGNDDQAKALDVDGKEITLDVTNKAIEEKTYNEYYLVTIEYATIMDGYQHDYNTGGQFLSLPATSTFVADLPTGVDGESEWAPAQAKVNTNVQTSLMKLRPTVEHTLRWPIIWNPRFKLINQQLGKINDGISKLFNNAPKHTVLFMGYRATRLKWWNHGATQLFRRDSWPEPYTIELRFSQMETHDTDESGNDVTYGWNWVWDPDHRKFVYVTSGKTNRPLYDRYDFDEAIRYWPGVNDVLGPVDDDE